MANDTYTALSTFIQSQKQLLAQTQRDIERLHQLRDDALADPDAVLYHLDDKLPDSITQPLAAAELPPSVDWSLFQTCDPAQMRALASTARLTHHAHAQPSQHQRAPLSPLQQLVKDARRTLLDPLLSSLALPSPAASDSDEEPSPAEQRKQRARAQIRELRMRRIGEGGLTLPRGLSGVHVRRDLDDESGEVVIALDDGPAAGASRPAPRVPTAPDAPLPPASTSAPPAPRARRAPQPRPASSKAKTKRASPPAPAPRTKDAPRPRPETYKQAWSVSEQHLLERLLDEIPDGSKNRWAQISKAMGGRRTPRQVASRVQKYFEKLRRFGVEVGAGRGTEELE